MGTQRTRCACVNLIMCRPKSTTMYLFPYRLSFVLPGNIVRPISLTGNQDVVIRLFDVTYIVHAKMQQYTCYLTLTIILEVEKSH